MSNDPDLEDSDSLPDSEKELQNDSRHIRAPAEQIAIDVLDDKPPRTRLSQIAMDAACAGWFKEEPRLHWGINLSTNHEVDLEEENDIFEDNRDNESDKEWRRQGQSKYLKDSLTPHCTSKTSTIFPAPSNMRLCDYKAYEPNVVTIGFIHFQKSLTLSPRLHQYKSQCVSYLLARHMNPAKEAELLEQCMKLVLRLEPHARARYSVDDERVSKQEFAEMLLQDGCFILHLLLKKNKERNSTFDQQIKSKDLSELDMWEREITEVPTIGALWIWNLVVYDLLKLENQIPFFVLQRLFDLLKTPDDESIDLVELALELLMCVHPKRAKTFVPPPSSRVLHLLHLFHSSLIPSKLVMEKTTEAEAPDWIPGATVLQDAGIKFRPPKERTAESFLEVTFKNGVMEIPKLQVDDFTSLVFRNLIAFEQCYSKITTHITTYARFMDDLVNTKRDVRLLSLDGVLLNKLGTEEAAADLLNKLCDQVNYTPEKNYLAKVFIDVTEYYDAPWHKWRATLVSNYFSNPWAIISALGAVALLLLTIIQAVFAPLAYFNPPK